MEKKNGKKEWKKRMEKEGELWCALFATLRIL